MTMVFGIGLLKGSGDPIILEKDHYNFDSINSDLSMTIYLSKILYNQI